MPRYWMISNRNIKADGLGKHPADPSFWVADSAPKKFSSWTRLLEHDFKKELIAAADAFKPLADPIAEHEDQKHLGMFIHGYNTNWQEACERYDKICTALFTGGAKLGHCVLFSWPSDGWATNYLPDRADAEGSRRVLADVLSALYDWMLHKQQEAAADDAKACKAKISIIAHSMGNYVLQKALQTVWTRNNRPLLVSLLNQVLMVAADVDNDIFKSGENIEDGDGDAIANLSYRVSVLYSPRDPVLGLSAGMKHFGQRRLGRSGLHEDYKPPRNVWQYDCSAFLPKSFVNSEVHGGYFDSAKFYDLAEKVLRGIDRTIIEEA